ncbi:hypothetical protein [Krasilnikovia sp. MM14-A1259]|uniref:hypothetical protein n=1 Tax=Krasilnikovia sp. MM14-A1259 TaxID=3373539 RepID=UPI003808F54C
MEIDTVSRVSVSECFRDDGGMSEWERLGAHVVARRVAMGYRARGDLASAVGISARVLFDIEKGRRTNYDAVTIAALEKALGWETGSVARVVAGGEPITRGVDENLRPPDVFFRLGPDDNPQDEIDLIYASRLMTAEQKLDAIRKVLRLRAQLEQEAASAAEAATSQLPARATE